MESYVEAPWRWPEGTVFAVLEEWTGKVESANENVIGSTPCYSELLRCRFPDAMSPLTRNMNVAVRCQY